MACQGDTYLKELFWCTTALSQEFIRHTLLMTCMYLRSSHLLRKNSNWTVDTEIRILNVDTEVRNVVLFQMRIQESPVLFFSSQDASFISAAEVAYHIKGHSCNLCPGHIYCWLAQHYSFTPLLVDLHQTMKRICFTIHSRSQSSLLHMQVVPP